MANAIDAFREQREAAEQVHQRLTAVAVLLTELRRQADALARDEDLRKVLREEQAWLGAGQRLVAEVRAFREAEQHRLWPATLRRWVVASLFALASAAVAGACYAAVSRQHGAEQDLLRSCALLLTLLSDDSQR